MRHRGGQGRQDANQTKETRNEDKSTTTGDQEREGKAPRAGQGCQRKENETGSGCRGGKGDATQLKMMNQKVINDKQKK